ncbi:hypothetical protein [Lacinutrix sp. Hel_I_90]|uniref:hypothetical protein n=1 Tax=Lacinutrix sp. Hel_I_90 TaxID=1249999 RepID=UPI000A57EBBF|nr:hypothetical protein [Lacinutrix sp. Hel_I_90]
MKKTLKKNLQKNLKVKLVLSLLFLSGCNPKSSETFFESILDLKKYEFYNDDLVLLKNTSIEDGILILSSIIQNESIEKRILFYFIDLDDKKLLKILESPIDEYVGLRYSLDNGMFYLLKNTSSETIYVNNIRDKNAKFEKKQLFEGIDKYTPFEFNVVDRTTYYTKDLKGGCVFNFKNYIFHEKSIFSTENADYNSLSLPLKKRNVFSYLKNDSLNIFCFYNKKEWQKKIPLKKTSNGTFFNSKIYNLNSLFVVKYNNNLVGLDKINGKEKWKKTFNANILNIYFYNDRLVIICNNHNSTKVIQVSDNGQVIKEVFLKEKIDHKNQIFFLEDKIIVHVSKSKNSSYILNLTTNNFENIKINNNQDLKQIFDKRSGKYYIKFGENIYNKAI